MHYRELYCQPFLRFSLNFLLFCDAFLPPAIPWHSWLSQRCRFSGSSRYPFLDSHNREAGPVNRFSVALSASAYLVHWLLCNCYYFEKSISFSSLQSDYMEGEFFLLRYILIRMFFFYFINTSIIKHRMKLSCSQCQRKQYNRHVQWGVS